MEAGFPSARTRSFVRECSDCHTSNIGQFRFRLQVTCRREAIQPGHDEVEHHNGGLEHAAEFYRLSTVAACVNGETPWLQHRDIRRENFEIVVSNHKHIVIQPHTNTRAKIEEQHSVSS